MTKLPTVKIKGKDYVQVKDRIMALKEETKGAYSISTDYQYFPDRKMWVVKATVKIGDQTYTGLAQEIESAEINNVNRTSALENAETSAVGRAIGMYGIGVIESFASANEVQKAQSRPVVNQTTGELFNPSKCADCGAIKGVSQKVVDFSKSAFGRVLCFNCQKAQEKPIGKPAQEDQYVADDLDQANNF